MIEFTKPENLNGAELIAELKASGINASNPTIDDNDTFWLDISKKDVEKAMGIVEAHNGTIIPPKATIAEKLASVGLSIDDLKAALA